MPWTLEETYFHKKVEPENLRFLLQMCLRHTFSPVCKNECTSKCHGERYEKRPSNALKPMHTGFDFLKLRMPFWLNDAAMGNSELKVDVRLEKVPYRRVPYETGILVSSVWNLVREYEF